MLFRNSLAAMREIEPYLKFLSNDQQEKLLSSYISKDDNEWCILSGPDLTFDRAGFGKTLSAAVQDYVAAFVKQTSMTIN